MLVLDYILRKKCGLYQNETKGKQFKGVQRCDKLLDHLI